METTPSLADIDLLKTGVAALAMLLVSVLWYSPMLFGKTWIRLSGIRPVDIRPGERQRSYVVLAFTNLVAATLLNLLALHLGIADRSTLFCGAAFVWLFVMLEQLNHVLWERQPFALFLLQALRALACLMAGAAIFYFWS